ALTDVEQAEITTIFTDAARVEDGLKWALRTVLMSPSFLYRSELGTKVSDLLANPVVAPGTEYDFAGTPNTIREFDIPAYQRFSRGNHERPYQWTGNDLIAVTIKGAQDGNGRWPILTVGMEGGGGSVIQQITINHSGYRTYYFTIDGSPGGSIYLHNDVNA